MAARRLELARVPAPHPDLGQSIEFMRQAHEGQIDKSGRPYYLHPLRVAMRLVCLSVEERHAALLHDVVEDTPVTLEDLRYAGYSEAVLELVALLTRDAPGGESHRQYMLRIVESRKAGALRVTLADIYDNLSAARMRYLPAHDLGLKRRFESDAEQITAALEAMGDTLYKRIIAGEL
jgi:GTP diphosphokinase / guanosine-3',5'-bis(diphosphate) 3'-diphosphatase